MQSFTDPRALDALREAVNLKMRRAALRAAPAAATNAKNEIRQQMAAAGLGRLGMAIGSGGDKQIHLTSTGWSVSGWVFIRSQSKRTRGAIKAYTEGAQIKPRGRWLWIATDDVKRLVGIPTGDGGRTRVRLEPHLWDRSYGQKFGPLQIIRGINGYPLMIVNGGTVSASGKRGSLRPLTKTGKVPRGQAARETIVAFYAIPNTSRAARLNVPAIANQKAKEMVARLGDGFSAKVL